MVVLVTSNANDLAIMSVPNSFRDTYRLCLLYDESVRLALKILSIDTFTACCLTHIPELYLPLQVFLRSETKCYERVSYFWP